MYILGDDNIILTNRVIDVSQHGTNTKNFYNMVSKVSQNRCCGGFLSMVVHNLDGVAQVVPHFKRLRHRYSVSNHTYNPLDMDEKIDQRTLSYCFMLGGITEA